MPSRPATTSLMSSTSGSSTCLRLKASNCLVKSAARRPPPVEAGRQIPDEPGERRFQGPDRPADETGKRALGRLAGGLVHPGQHRTLRPLLPQEDGVRQVVVDREDLARLAVWLWQAGVSFRPWVRVDLHRRVHSHVSR